MAKKKENDIDALMADHERLASAAEELRKKLNGIIAEYELSSDAVLLILARITAGYLNMTQRLLDQEGVAESIADNYNQMLNAYLFAFKMASAKFEAEQPNKDDLN